MEEYRNIFKQTWPKLLLFLGAGILLFIIFGKFMLWFFAKAAVKTLGLAIIGIGLLFGFFKHRNTTADNS